MKFHKERTAIRSELEGITEYEKAIGNGTLVSYPIHRVKLNEQPGVWRKMSVAEIAFRDESNMEPLEISEIQIQPREAVVDELTRHPNTIQVFLPITGEFLVALTPSREDDIDSPDPSRIVMVPAKPGEAVEVGAGTWHTLPFAFCSNVIGLSIMHRERLDSYHDVRDLIASGWVGFLRWSDPE